MEQRIWARPRMHHCTKINHRLLICITRNILSSSCRELTFRWDREPRGAPLMGESGDCELTVIRPGNLGDVRICAVGGSASVGGLGTLTAARYEGRDIDWSEGCLG